MVRSKITKIIILVAILSITVIPSLSPYYITYAASVGNTRQVLSTQEIHLLATTSCSSDSSDAQANETIQNNPIMCNYIKPATEFLSAGVGIVVIAMIIIGAIQYISSSGNPQATSEARKKIINAVIALILFGLMYALLNFIIPGGLIVL